MTASMVAWLEASPDWRPATVDELAEFAGGAEGCDVWLAPELQGRRRAAVPNDSCPANVRSARLGVAVHDVFTCYGQHKLLSSVLRCAAEVGGADHEALVDAVFATLLEDRRARFDRVVFELAGSAAQGLEPVR